MGNQIEKKMENYMDSRVLLGTDTIDTENPAWPWY